MINISPITEKRRLDYACRRGTRELETLVRAFLDIHYDQVDTESKNIFHWLLSMEDDQLWDWIYIHGNENPQTNHQYVKKEVHTQVKQAIDEYIVTRKKF